MQTLDSQRLNLRTLDSGLEYYQISLFSKVEGKAEIESYTHFVGWADSSQKIEIREPSKVVASRFVEHWTELNLEFTVVNNLSDAIVFMLCGGLGLIELNVAKTVFSNLWNANETVRLGNTGFVGRRSVDDNTFNRAPNPKKRMMVLKRDSRQCRVCGRRPETNSDIELHIHHIRPWAEGGLTHPNNLITLCHTCHNGLDPHFDPSLFSYITNEPKNIAEYVTRVRIETAAYRRATIFQNM